MTISSALTALNTDIQNARTAITNKGGTVTSGGGSSQLATDIATIPSGGGSSGTPYTTIVALENAMRGTSEVASTEEAEACDDISYFLYGIANS
jgi:hypothetical protein